MTTLLILLISLLAPATQARAEDPEPAAHPIRLNCWIFSEREPKKFVVAQAFDVKPWSATELYRFDNISFWVEWNPYFGPWEKRPEAVAALGIYVRDEKAEKNGGRVADALAMWPIQDKTNLLKGFNTLRGGWNDAAAGVGYNYLCTSNEF